MFIRFILVFLFITLTDAFSDCNELFFGENFSHNLTQLFDKGPAKEIREILLPLLKDTQTRERLGHWVFKDLQRLSAHYYKNRHEIKTGGKTIFVGAGAKTMVALASLKSMLKEKFNPHDFLVLEKEKDVAFNFYNGHFRLNSPFFDNLGNEVNHLENGLFQLADLADSESTVFPYAHDLAIILALNYRYLNVPIILNSNVHKLSNPSAGVYTLSTQNAPGYKYSTNRVVGHFGEGQSVLPRNFPNGLEIHIQKSVEEEGFSQGQVYYANQFLRKFKSLPREELDKFFEGKNIAIVGSGHGGMTVLESLTTQIHSIHGLKEKPKDSNIVLYTGKGEEITKKEDFLELAATGKSENEDFKAWMRKRYSTYLDVSKHFQAKEAEVYVLGERVERILFTEKTLINNELKSNSDQSILVVTNTGKNQYEFDILIFATGYTHPTNHQDTYFGNYANSNISWRHLEEGTAHTYSGGSVKLSLFNTIDELITSSIYGDTKKTYSREFPIAHAIGTISLDAVRLAKYIYKKDYKDLK